MKAFYVLLALIFLTSCGAEVASDPIELSNEVVEQTVEEIDEAISELPVEVTDIIEEDTSDNRVEEEISKPEEDVIQPEVEWKDEETIVVDEQAAVSPKVVELSAKYNNPAMEVVMNIEYTLDSENNISDISVTSPNYKGMPEFNAWAQGVLGMTVGEASEYYVSGSSLTTPAFQKALKNSM